jgi:hypothetical protein
MKICKDCGEEKPESEYHKAGPRLKPRCKDCDYFYAVQLIHGISPEHYRELWEEQNGCCAICRRDLESSQQRRSHVDHDHLTGIVRGLLCANCNHGIGNFHENVAYLLAATRYLARHSLARDLWILDQGEFVAEMAAGLATIPEAEEVVYNA